LLKKEREKLEKNHKDKDDNCYAYSIGIKNETNSSVLKLFKEMKEANKELTSHICHRCEQKYHHLNTIRRLQNLE